MTATTGQDRDIAAAYASGLSVPACAVKFDISRYAVKGALARTATPTRPAGRPSRPCPWEAQAAARYQAGESVRRLAREFGAGTQRVKAAIERQGITVRRGRRGRPPGGAA